MTADDEHSARLLYPGGRQWRGAAFGLSQWHRRRPRDKGARRRAEEERAHSVHTPLAAAENGKGSKKTKTNPFSSRGLMNGGEPKQHICRAAARCGNRSHGRTNRKHAPPRTVSTRPEPPRPTKRCRKRCRKRRKERATGGETKSTHSHLFGQGPNSHTYRA